MKTSREEKNRERLLDCLHILTPLIAREKKIQN